MLKKKVAAALAALSMFAACLLPVPALAATEYVPQETSCRTLTERLKAQQADRNVVPDAVGRPYTKQYYYEQLDSASKAVYDAILRSALAQGPSMDSITVDLSSIPANERTIIASFVVRKAADGSEDEVNSPECAKYTSDTVDPALTAIMFDHSELSWLRNTEYGCSLSWDGRVSYNLSGMNPGETRVFSNYTLVVTDMVFQITPRGYAWATTPCDTQSGSDKYSYADTGDLSRIQQALASAVSRIGDISGLSVPDRIQTIHDWVCTHMDYADKSDARFLNDWRGYQTAYSALVEGRTVCAGYSAAFKLLCDAYDIPCVIVRGLDGVNGNHVWNYVEVDGQWYGIDCTWDDKGQTVLHDFFLRGSDNFLAAGKPGYHEERLLFDPYPFAYPVLAHADYDRTAAPVVPEATAPAPTPVPSVAAQTPAPIQTLTPVHTLTPEPVATTAPISTLTPLTSTEVPATAASASKNPGFWPPLRAANNAELAFELQHESDGVYLVGISAQDAAAAEHLVHSADVSDGMHLRIVNADGTSLPAGAPVATGQRAQVLDEDGTIVWTATLVVRGDVLGTGHIVLSQLVQMSRQLRQHKVLEGPYLMAADLTGDGKFSISDLVMQAGMLSDK